MPVPQQDSIWGKLANMLPFVHQLVQTPRERAEYEQQWNAVNEQDLIRQLTRQRMEREGTEFEANAGIRDLTRRNLTGTLQAQPEMDELERTVRKAQLTAQPEMDAQERALRSAQINDMLEPEAAPAPSPVLPHALSSRFGQVPDSVKIPVIGGFNEQEQIGRRVARVRDQADRELAAKERLLGRPLTPEEREIMVLGRPKNDQLSGDAGFAQWLASQPEEVQAKVIGIWKQLNPPATQTRGNLTDFDADEVYGRLSDTAKKQALSPRWPSPKAGIYAMALQTGTPLIPNAQPPQPPPPPPPGQGQSPTTMPPLGKGFPISSFRRFNTSDELIAALEAEPMDENLMVQIGDNPPIRLGDLRKSQ